MTDNGLVIFHISHAMQVPCDSRYTRGVQDRRYSSKRDKRPSKAVENRVWVSMGLVVVIWCYPCYPCSYFCDLWSRWVYYNGMDKTEWNPNMQEGAYPKKKKRCVADQFTVVKHKSETYYWAQKLNREDYGVDELRVLGTSCCCQRVNLALLTNNKYCCVHFTNLAGWDLKLAGWDYDF